MRPRVFPAEDAAWFSVAYGMGEASMRPRVFPAEDNIVSCPAVGTLPRFNEAAGIPRGRQHAADYIKAASDASMRPRVFPAEDAGGPRVRPRSASCFNEAAGIPRGRPTRASAPTSGTSALQ